MQESSGQRLYLCLFLALCIWHTKASFGDWTLIDNAGPNAFTAANWICDSGASLDCQANATPNNAQNIAGLLLGSSFVYLPNCSSDQVLQFPTNGLPILWPSIKAKNYCYQLYITGSSPTFSVHLSSNPLPPLKFVLGNVDAVVEQLTNTMTLSSLHVENSAAVTIAAANIRSQGLYMTRPTTVNFKRARSSASTVGTNSVILNGTTTIEYPIPQAGATVWNVNSVTGITFAGPFNLTSVHPAFELSVYNQTGSTGAVITVTAPTFLITNGKLSLYSVTSGTSSTMSGTTVILKDIATLKLAGSWGISSSTSVSGNGTLDLSAALPTNGFTLPSTHTDHTIKVAASSTLLATGSFSGVTLSSTGSFTVDRQNAEGVMDINAINAVTSVTLKNGKFRLVGTTVSIFLVSAELTVTGSVGYQISGDADSTIIVDSVGALKAPPIESDGDFRLWNYAYILYGKFNAGKGIFLEKKCQATVAGASTLPDATTVDDATLTLENTFTFGVPIIVQNNGLLNLSPREGAVYDVRFANVSLLSGGQIINHAEFTPNGDGVFGLKGAKQGEFVSYAPIVVSNVTFTTDKLTLKENASLIVEASGVVSASTVYAAPSTWIDFAGTIHLTDEFLNDGEVYWGGKDSVGNSVLTGTYAQNSNGTTFLTITSLNDTQPAGEFDTLTVTGDVYLFGTLQLEFADTASALALPDQAWYPIITLTGSSGGVFDKVEHNLGDAEVTFKLCFTETQGILVLTHNSTTSAVTFADLPSGCDFVNPVPMAVPVENITGPSSEPSDSTVSSAVTFSVSYIVLLVSVLVLAGY